jgi:O-acetyl-ADP-ribose deacetylase (regulator of RNase III)
MLDEAAPIALSTVKAYVQMTTSLKLMRFVLFSQPVYAAFQRALQTLVDAAD